MKKILIAFDGHHFSEGAFEFVRRLNETEPVLVTGVFLPVVDYAEMLYSVGGLSGPMYFQDIELDDTGVVQKNIDQFKNMCLKNGIEFRVHPDIEKHIVHELRLESRYADLMIVSSDLFYQNLGVTAQEEYVEEVMHKSECPVVLVPEKYTFPESVILAYDGSENSVYAIKQFAYLFPELTDLKTLLVYVGTNEIPSLTYIEELTARHFSDLNICQLEINIDDYFNSWVFENGNSILVSGAYGRTAMSELFFKSFLKTAIKEKKTPLFIAHK